MSWSNEFVELDKSIHDRNSFNCEEAELNNFIHKLAARHMDAKISRTFVLPSLKPLASSKKLGICSFYTITPSSIERKQLPEKLAKKLPQYPVPVFLLAQLAVDINHQQQGLGSITLINALQKLLDISHHISAYAIIVDCLNESAKNFYLKYGFQELCQHHKKTRMFLSMKTVEQLFK